MKQQLVWIGVAAVLAVGAAAAQSQFPLVDKLAAKVVQKYETSTCEQLWQQRGKPGSPEEQKALTFLKSDPQRRQEFFNRIAGPVMNKKFECGMIP